MNNTKTSLLAKGKALREARKVSEMKVIYLITYKNVN